MVVCGRCRYYSRRYVGELSLLLPEKDVLRFSTLDFWGNREVCDEQRCKQQHIMLIAEDSGIMLDMRLCDNCMA